MNLFTWIECLTRGTRWAWLSDQYQSRVPSNLVEIVMDLQSHDRYHAKQGRSTCRVRLDGPDGAVSVYLKRHTRLPWIQRLAALVHPQGRHSPAGAEWRHLQAARALGVPVPDPVAVGERIGPWGRFESYLMVAELVGHLPLHEAIPDRFRTLDSRTFQRWKRGLIRELAALVARLHQARAYHKDLYLCHFYLDMDRWDQPGRLVLIDLHRLGVHRWTSARWRWKDLAALMFSTWGVEGIDDRDRLRFWSHYRRSVRLRAPDFESRMIRAKARRYDRHDRRAGSGLSRWASRSTSRSCDSP